MSIELAVRHARRSMRWALVSAILSTGLPILALVGDGSRWIFLASMAYAVFGWATFFVQRRAHRAALTSVDTDGDNGGYGTPAT